MLKIWDVEVEGKMGIWIFSNRGVRLSMDRCITGTDHKKPSMQTETQLCKMDVGDESLDSRLPTSFTVALQIEGYLKEYLIHQFDVYNFHVEPFLDVQPLSTDLDFLSCNLANDMVQSFVDNNEQSVCWLKTHLAEIVVSSDVTNACAALFPQEQVDRYFEYLPGEYTEGLEKTLCDNCDAALDFFPQASLLRHAGETVRRIRNGLSDLQMWIQRTPPMHRERGSDLNVGWTVTALVHQLREFHGILCGANVSMTDRVTRPIEMTEGDFRRAIDRSRNTPLKYLQKGRLT